MATDWQPGMLITAERLNDSSPLNWTAWTPEWSTESGGNGSSYGNSDVLCRYVQFGRTVLFNIDITFGSTTVFAAGSDNWTFGLPVAAALSDAPMGYASIYPSASDGDISGIPTLFGTDTFKVFVSSGPVNSATFTPAGGWVDSTTPYTWTSGHRLLVTGQYETAA